MPDRIIIEFDDEKNKTEKDETRLVINLDEEKKIEVDNFEEDYEESILKSKINSFYKSGPGLDNYFESELKFPEGIDKGFRKKFSLSIKDEFFNTILESNRFIILSSKGGNIYLIDRFKGVITEKIFFENETFEKTGLVFNNQIFINSIRKIYRLEYHIEKKIEQEEIYFTGNEKLLWSNLNRFKDYLLFTEYSSSDKRANLKIIDMSNSYNVTEFNFDVNRFISDRICIANDCAFILFDSKLLIYDLERQIGEIHTPEIKTDENSFIFYLNYRIYITSHLNELYYADLPSLNSSFKNTGIKNNYINSIGAFADNIFMGTLDGWKFYKSSGLPVYNFEDEYENKIEAISSNVLLVSQKNKIVFCNLNRFQEAEGYVIASKEKPQSIEIVSAVFSKNEIFILTKNGILEGFTNDQLNIHV